MESDFQQLTVGVVGLGLMGGSMAKTIKARTLSRVLGWNRTRATAEQALADGSIDAIATEALYKEADLVIIGLYPQATVDWLLENMPKMKKGCVIVDMVGVKQFMVDHLEQAALDAGVHYVGGHPMAGSHKAGYKNARANLFHAAPMVLVPPEGDDIALLARAKELLAPAEFGRFSVTSAAEHDRMIAFTSQLSHVVSNAYIKSPTACSHKGFSAGSYKDLTRVAWLNAPMWTELFMDNRDFLLAEIDTLIGNLRVYRDALADGDAAALCSALEEGKRRKEEVDGI